MPAPRKKSLPLSIIVSLLLVSCGGEDGVGIKDITAVTVSPATTTLASLGATQQLSATGKVGTSTVPEATFTWSSSDAGVASVGPTGLVTAVANGTATITASVSIGGASGTATITVAQEASTITLSVADVTIAPGATTQITASVADAGGSALGAPHLSWSSSDDAIATVDDTGLVTGVAEGQVTITAAQDGASGTVDVGVIRPDLRIEDDQTLGGTITVATMTVAAGVTVTLAEDASIDASGPVTIEGTVSGDCTALTVTGQGAVVVSGTLNTACVATPGGGESAPGITITSPGGVDLTDATIVASGPVTVTSKVSGAAVFASGGGPRVAGSSATSGTVTLVGTHIAADPSEAPQPDSPSDPIPHGADVKFDASGGIIIDGVSIRAQSGGPGAPASQTSDQPLDVRAGAGGTGGDISINIPTGGTIDFRTSRGKSTFQPGDGGPGGPATAITSRNAAIDPAPAATAVGGEGGRGGETTFLGSATITGDITLIQWQVGIGGRGGNATALGADGVDASATRAAQVGGNATANAGPGGNAGLIDGGYEGLPTPDPKQGGSGGVAHATAGQGGGGIRGNADGASGGNASASGGRGGNSFETSGRTGGDAVAEGGNGGKGADVCPAFDAISLAGMISVGTDTEGSDPFIFNAGAGGIALSVALRILNAVGGPGGAGGDGGLLSSVGGQGGFGRAVYAPDGTPAVGPGASGGNGGAGVSPGPGGNPGGLSAGSDQSATRFNPIFQKGSAGGACPSSAPALTVRVTAASAADRTIQINGSAPWVDVSGTLAEDGTVTATGTGTVAGFSNIDVSFSGTYDQSSGRLQGNYSMDTGHVISPGHPIIYVVDVSTGG